VDLGRAISFGMTRKIQKTLTYSHFLHLSFPTPNKEREKTKTSHQKCQNNWDFSIFFPHPFRFFSTHPQSPWDAWDSQAVLVPDFGSPPVEPSQ
jgi:hypothetical protein